tara:strand:+ start:39 stop:269 length:231 start_codon:yes stop_codon:yes gene_type:complete
MTKAELLRELEDYADDHVLICPIWAGPHWLRVEQVCTQAEWNIIANKVDRYAEDLLSDDVVSALEEELTELREGAE